MGRLPNTTRELTKRVGSNRPSDSSKKNREKRFLEVEKQLADRSEDKAMQYISALQTAQQATKSAHVIMTGVHAIKASVTSHAAAGSARRPRASDPRSKSESTRGPRGDHSAPPLVALLRVESDATHGRDGAHTGSAGRAGGACRRS